MTPPRDGSAPNTHPLGRQCEDLKVITQADIRPATYSISNTQIVGGVRDGEEVVTVELPGIPKFALTADAVRMLGSDLLTMRGVLLIRAGELDHLRL